MSRPKVVGVVDAVIPKLIAESSRLNAATSGFVAERAWPPVVLMTAVVVLTFSMVTLVVP